MDHLARLASLFLHFRSIEKMLMNPIIQTGALNFASFHERLVMILCVALTGSRRVSLNHNTKDTSSTFGMRPPFNAMHIWSGHHVCEGSEKNPVQRIPHLPF